MKKVVFIAIEYTFRIPEQEMDINCWQGRFHPYEWNMII